MISKIKNKLNETLKDIVLDLNEEELLFVAKFKEANSPLEKLVEICLRENSVKVIKTITANLIYPEKVDNNIKSKNKSLFTRLFFIENQILYQKLIKKFFNEGDLLPEFTGLKEFLKNAEEYDLDNRKFKIINNSLEGNLIKNPYNNLITGIKFIYDSNVSNILKDVKIDNRKIYSNVKINQFETLKDILYIEKTDKKLANLNDTFSLEDILNFKTEFVLYHELAHASINKKVSNQLQSEIFSDICGIISVIKNNNLNKENSLNFINLIIAFRASNNTITGQIFAKDDIIHTTQNNLSILKQWINEDFNFIKNSNKEEEVVIAEELASLKIDNLIALGINNDNAIFTLLNGWSKELGKTDSEVEEASNVLKNKNLSTKELSNLFFSYYFLTGKNDDLYNYYPINSFKSKIILSSLKNKIEEFKSEIEKNSEVINSIKDITHEKLTKLNKLIIK